MNGVTAGRLRAPWGSLLDSGYPVEHRHPSGHFESEVVLVAYADPVSMAQTRDMVGS